MPVTPEVLVAEQNWDLDQTYLYMIAAESDMLDRVASSLRQAGEDDLAKVLDKFQQDVGVEIVPGDDPAPGPETASLRAAYEPVPLQRLDILREVHDLIQDVALKGELESLIALMPTGQQPCSQVKMKPHP